jgi:hypothetical protein
LYWIRYLKKLLNLIIKHQLRKFIYENSEIYKLNSNLFLHEKINFLYNVKKNIKKNVTILLLISVFFKSFQLDCYYKQSFSTVPENEKIFSYFSKTNIHLFYFLLMSVSSFSDVSILDDSSDYYFSSSRLFMNNHLLSCSYDRCSYYYKFLISLLETKLNIRNKSSQSHLLDQFISVSFLSELMVKCYIFYFYSFNFFLFIYYLKMKIQLFQNFMMWLDLMI